MPVLLVVTALGDPAVVVALATLVYWLGPRYDLCDRRAGATVLATVFLALASTLFLKYAFAMPRPPAELMLVPEDGAGFPSGHVTAATATYAALAVYGNRFSSGRRYTLAAALVSVVALTRVLLGVHYVVDVVAGLVLGLVALAAVRWVSRENLALAFATSVPLAFGGTLLAGTVEAALLIGFVSGATLGWWLVDGRLTGQPIPIGAIVGAGIVGAVLIGVGYESGVPVVAGFTAAGAGALFLALPALDA
ncbi:phosphatase PAP2 family protein [Halanaeroarchaeum sulfurireducens]|uniref:PA-phosphatase-like phosphoesterase n=1 Tax=Halanaeroarchaeum sulfurireducens TaxID=1604004 RepID=A0A0F7PCQ8_9EURY|nr:phosphatase PAP2 family protein [Halanaeroarchaeum sulfurireducens]AKH98477.1 PA-phosphatase-like phosphoesterase [Halanaeroarchaeum sulfurireducens]ALG82871.1 PA-phosphatase-like phosphoesterase [Halanaeroarchaeum sulfurireducens]